MDFPTWDEATKRHASTLSRKEFGKFFPEISCSPLGSIIEKNVATTGKNTQRDFLRRRRRKQWEKGGVGAKTMRDTVAEHDKADFASRNYDVEGQQRLLSCEDAAKGRITDNPGKVCALLKNGHLCHGMSSPHTRWGWRPIT